MNNKMQIIIEGNIGCGKTTCIDKLEKNDFFEVIREPVNLWLSIKNSNGKNLLQEFYEEPERYSYLFQTIVFKTRLQSTEHEQIKPVRFCERSVWSDKFIFSKACINSGKMNQLESKCYNQWFNWLESKFYKKPNGIVYLKCSPEKCFERMYKRGRNEENTIPIEYLKELDDLHEEWIRNWKETPVLIIDNEKDDDWDNILNKINNFIIELSNCNSKVVNL